MNGARSTGRAWAGALLAGAACGPTAPLPLHARAAQSAPPSAQAPAACDARSLPPDVPARRLSVHEYVSTLTDLFSLAPALHAVPESVAMDLVQLPRDGEAGASFSNMDARTSQRHVATYLQIAEKIARASTNHDEQLAALASGCALATPLDAPCFQRFVRDFGLRAWRRPLTPVELARFTGLADTQPPRLAYELAIAELLAAPQFLFHLEHGAGDTPAEQGPRALSPYELASRLSYHFWQSTPDERSLAAAASGALGTDAGYRAEVLRLTGAQRARSTWYRFFREWLALDDFGGFAHDRAFDNFSGSVPGTPELYQDAVWEIEQLAGYYTFDSNGSYGDLLTSDLVFTRSARLAKLYDVEPWDGRSVPAAFPAGDRSGLLTRAALLISANHATNPFRRGAFVRRRLLCEPIEPPSNLPPGALSIPTFDPSASTRVRYERKIAAPQCQGCHALFAPYGYALEAYDALGRHRSSERLYDDGGEYQGHAALDVRARVQAEPRWLEVNGPVELSRALADSPEASACFVRQYFRFTFRRKETAADACTLGAMQRSLEASGLRGLYRDVAFTEAFRSRVAARAAPATDPSPPGDPR